MNKYSFIFLFLVVFQIGFSQNKTFWKGYFSYNVIKDFSQSEGKLFAASENAIFTRNIVSGEISTTNTIDGLSGQTISSFYHSVNFKKTVVGYENGLITVINEEDGSMINVVDIINKSLPPNIKKINHFMEHEGILYVSCDFGIVQYNLTTLQFGDTYFIGDGGTQISVNQTAVYNGDIYASTLSNGIRSASITDPNLIDFEVWSNVANSGWSGIEVFGDDLLAVNTSGSLQRLQGNSFVSLAMLPENIEDIRNSGSYLVITTKNHILIYNSTLTQVADINVSQISDVLEFTCATVINNTVFIGTINKGVFSAKIGESVFKNTIPDGPLRNNLFAINVTSKNIWAVYGGYDEDYNPYGFNDGLTELSISKFSNKGWLEIPYKDLLEAKSLSRITVNPSNENQVFVSSFYSGLLKLENDKLSTLYNASNTGTDGLTSIAGQVPDDIRVNGAAFDKSGNLWVTSSLVKNGLKVLSPAKTWKSYSMQSVKPTELFSFGRLIIDKNGTKWMTTLNDGVIGFNENYNSAFKTIKSGTDIGNLPVNDVKSIAVDANNQMWIGTRKGLRVLSNVSNFLSSNQLNTTSIIILEGDLAQELLFEQSITDIVVDGANNKWIGTADSGVFLVSSNGQQTIHHFTINNSPLPSNTVNDIDINGTTGEVFIATIKGMVSFKGTSTDANDNLNNVYIYPNPVRPEYTGTLKISGLIDDANIKISDIEGNLVYEATSEGGTIEWDTTAFGKYKVASGVYMILISAKDGVETKVKKVMIIR